MLATPDGWFYAYATQTTSGDGLLNIQVARSVDLVRWEHLGDANAYMKIFNANKDQLSDPDKIKPGQVLKIPAN